ncbi:MAG: hypothetical protein WBI53_07550 [Paludibacter sp.]
MTEPAFTTEGCNSDSVEIAGVGTPGRRNSDSVEVAGVGTPASRIRVYIV